MIPSESAETSDADLVSRTRRGDDEAFAELVRRHERRVYNLTYRVLGRAEDARDAAQDAFVSCYRNLAKFRGEAAFGTWLHRIAVNACYDLLRKRPPDPVELVEGLGAAASGDHAEDTAGAVDVQRALLRVPADFRTAMILHDVQGVPYEEIAVILDVPVGTVKSRLHRGRVALGEALRVPAGKRGGEPATAKPPSKRAAVQKRAARSKPQTTPKRVTQRKTK